MSMKTYINLEMSHNYQLPTAFQDCDVRFPESLVEYFLKQYTQKGDTVLDPFAGYGTTLFVAERMGRIPYGVEINQDRVNFAKTKLSNSTNIIQGDSRSLAHIDLPKIDFSITSPPYMTKKFYAEYPFRDYKVIGKEYKTYLHNIRAIYKQLRTFMKPMGKIILEVSNLKTEKQVTPLAWDIGQEISKVLHFDGEVVICWDKYDFGYDHSYCLVFSAQ